MRSQQISMFDGQRLTLDDAIDLTRQSLIAYGLEYRHWAIAYSGGKDSSALLKVVRYLIIRDLIPPPASLTVLYSDTRQEIPPLAFVPPCCCSLLPRSYEIKLKAAA